MTRTLSIDGMTCGHCTGTVEKALRATPGVTDVKVDLASKSAVVTTSGDVSNDTLIQAVTDTGFDIVGVS